MGTVSFPGVKSGRDVTLTSHPLLVPRSKRQSRAIPLLSLRAFVACKKGKTCLLYCRHIQNVLYYSLLSKNLKIKMQFTLEQETKNQRGSRGIAVLFL
jgi:hypothetical protein